MANANFQIASVDDRFHFDDASFDAIICIDAANHFPDRLHVIREWARASKPGASLLFTDPVVITGARNQSGIVRPKQYRNVRLCAA